MEQHSHNHAEPFHYRSGNSRAWTDAQKKTLIACERDVWSRTLFAVERLDVDPADVVVLDEFGSNLNMTRRYARAARGDRAVAALPRNTPQNTTTISSLTLEGIGPSHLINGSLTTDVFEAYSEQVLAPSLRRGQIVILDNLSAHKSLSVRDLLAERGVRLWYLPSYSPDYSPIELAFSKIKAELRRVGARTPEALQEAIAQALTHISATEARAFFSHCGFRLRPDPAQWFRI